MYTKLNSEDIVNLSAAIQQLGLLTGATDDDDGVCCACFAMRNSLGRKYYVSIRVDDLYKIQLARRKKVSVENGKN